MGGGAAMTMRAAAKVASFFVNTSSRSGPTSVPLPDHSVASAALKGKRPVQSLVSSLAIEDGKTAISVSSQNGKNDGVSYSQKPSWEIDDWEVAGGEDDLVLDSMKPLPRVVFGTLPSFEEAKEATSDLKEALDKVGFTSQKASSVGEDSRSSLQSSGHPETKACVTVENAVVQPSAANPAFQAFSLLKENPAAQNVVASLASDKDVWEAVMKNVKVVEFMEQYHNSAPSPDVEVKYPLVTEYHDEYEESSKSSVNIDAEKGSGNVFVEFIQEVKVRLVKMVHDFSGYFQNIFGPADENVSVDGNGNAAAEKSLGASFMALATLAIMVIVLKRV